MKKIIFDLDDTLIMFDPKYIESYQIALQTAGYESTYEDAKLIFDAIDEFGLVVDIYTKEGLLDFINQKSNKNYEMILIDEILNAVGLKWTNPVTSDLIELLDYLYKKYDLYVLTNFFTDCQTERLKNVGIDHYFKEVVGCDKVKAKPNKEAFLYFGLDSIMIGDNLENDVKGAINAGLDAILYDFKNKYSDLEYKKVTNYKELMDML